MNARTIRTTEVFGTIASIRLAGRAPLGTAEALDAALAELAGVDATFSPYRHDSEVSRIRRGELALRDASPDVREVAARCAAAAQRTGGLFRADWRGGFDPTGYVKGWSVERAATRHLAGLIDAGATAVAIGVGGDVRVFTADDADWTWTIGIADPRDRASLIATVDVRDGAIATSGSAERGAHILDPRTGEPARGLASATVLAPSLEEADLWATAAAVAGFDDLSWTRAAPRTTGITVAADGRTRRWIAGTEVLVTPVA